MVSATKKKAVRNTTLRNLGLELARLRARIEDLEDRADLNAAVGRNAGKSGTPWPNVKAELGLP